MIRSKFVAALAAVVLSVGTISHAAVIGVESGQVSQSVLPTHIVNDLRVDFTGNIRTQQMIVELTSGAIYQDSFGSNLPPNPALFVPFPSSQYDTFLAMGSAQAQSPEPAAGGNLAAVNIQAGSALKFDTAGINVAWFPTAGLNIGDSNDFLTGRVTLTNTANGTIRYWGSTQGEDTTGIQPFVGTITNGVISFSTVVDPAPDLGLMATNAGGLSAALQGVWNSKVSGTSISLIDGLMITNDDPNSDDITELGAIGSSVEITNYAGQGVIGTVSAGTVPGKYSLLLTGPFQDFDPSVPLTGNVNFTSANGGTATLAFSVAVPEPSTVALSALALVGLVGFARRKK